MSCVIPEFKYSKSIKKAGKISLYCLSILIGLLLVAYLLLRLPATQTWATQRIASYLSGKLKTKVEVKGVDIDFFKTLVLEGVYVEDLHRDTLLYAQKLRVDINTLNFKKHSVLFNTVKLEDGKFYLKQYRHEKGLNMDFISEAFASNDTSKSPGWYLKRSSLELKNLAFKLDYEDDTIQPYGVDYAHMYVTHLDASFNNIYIGDGTFVFKMKKLSLREKSGFYLQEMSSDFVRLNSKEMYLQNLHIKTPSTALSTDIRFTYSTWSDFKEFNTKVMMEAALEKTKVSMADIAYFAPALKGMQNQVMISGYVKGTVSQLKGKNLKINIGKSTSFRGNITMRGLPDINETFIEFAVDSLRTDKRDIETIPLPPFDQNKFIQLPENFSSLGKIRFRGKFNGFMNDFVAYGDLKCDLGELSSDLNLKYNDKRVLYSGHIKSTDFNIGRLLDQENVLGRLSLNADIKGSGLDKENANATVEGKVDNIDFYRYSYRNITLNGQIAKGLFSGKASMKDDNIGITFNGNVNMNAALPVFNFDASIENARLKKLNLLNRDSTSSLSALISAQLSGNNIDNLSGAFTAREVKYAEKGDTYLADHIIVSSNTIGLEKTITLSSDFMDGSVRGDYKVMKLWSSFRQMVSGYVNNVFPESRMFELPDESLSFDFKIKNTQALSTLFFPDFGVAEGTEISGSYNSSKADFSLSLNSSDIRLKKFRFRDIILKSATAQNRIGLNFSSSGILLGDSAWMKNIQVSGESNKNGFTFGTRFANHDSTVLRADLKGRVVVQEENKFFINILPSSNVVLQGNSWKINKNNSITIDTSFISVAELGFYQGNQKIDIGGRYVYKANPVGGDNEKLIVSFSDFQLANLNPFITSSGFEIKGNINGKALMYTNPVNTQTGLSSNIDITRLKINNDSLGTSTIIASWDDQSKIVSLLANIIKDENKTLELKGQYDTSRDKDNLNFDITLQKAPLPLFSHYIKDFVSDLRGWASAGLHISGTFKDPSIKGSLKLQRTSFVINYLNTLYSLSDEFTITDTYIALNGVTLNDVKGNRAVVNGKIYHNKFKNFRLDLDIDARKFMCLNTTAGQNSQYYGTAFATGRMSVSGNIGNLVMNIDMKSEKGTQINIPLSNPEEVGESSFVKFVDHRKLTKAGKSRIYKSYMTDISGLQMNFDLEVTPDADFQLIFDSKIGDVIKGKGYGNIKMEISTLGDFKMYGDYTIETGDYLFTLQNVINKRFKIDRGEVIKWNGSPTNAEINLTATYSLKTSLFELVPREEFRQQFPVQCKLIMTNRLFNPNIRFDIIVVGGHNEDMLDVNQALGKNDQGNQDKLNQQVFYLLAFNKFADLNNTAATANPNSNSNNIVNTTGTELLSNQVSNWVSQLSNQLGKDININFNYRQSNSTTNQRDIDVNYSTNFFNDRVIVNGNVGRTYLQNSSNIVGDFNIEYKVSPEGKFRLRGFNRLNNNVILNNGQQYTQGFGIFYREEFGTFKELIERYKRKKMLKKQ